MLEERPGGILVFEPVPHFGAGVAYSTDDARHLLNAQARSMSTFEDQPDHFVKWLSPHNANWNSCSDRFRMGMRPAFLGRKPQAPR